MILKEFPSLCGQTFRMTGVEGVWLLPGVRWSK